MVITGLIVSILISVCLGMYCYYLKHNKQQVVQLNAQRQKENQKIEEENKRLELKRQELISGVQAQDNILKSLSTTREQMEKDAETAAQKLYDAKVEEILTRANELKSSLSAEYKKLEDTFNLKIEKQREELNDLLAKQLAYIQAQKRQEQIEANQDYYRLALDKIDLDDIALLRELQPRFSKKESIDKLIWEVYFKPAYDILMSHLFDGTKKVCGIYKITDLTTGQAYIGQSIDTKERFRQHIKSALSYSKATNKLYQTMKKSGVHNFTFEILEEVSRDKLNERETYWINFYRSKEFGLNSTSGGS